MFKIGDKVRRIGGSWLGMRRGDIGTVTFASTNAVKLAEFCESTQSTHSASMLELVESATTPRKHAEVIKAWADGAVIQTRRVGEGAWTTCGSFSISWDDFAEYRVKPTPKPDVVKDVYCFQYSNGQCGINYNAVKSSQNLRLTFDAETNSLKAVELIK